MAEQQRALDLGPGGATAEHARQPLHQTILRILETGQYSISGLARELAAIDRKLNKLILTGYLRAMEDYGKVEAVEIPPAKVYSGSVHPEPDFFELVGERVREFERDPDRRVALAISVLQLLFQRPVFDEELRRCGMSGRFPAAPPPKAKRKIALKAANRAGLPVTEANQQFLLSAPLTERAHELLADLLIEGHDLGRYLPPAKQTTLPI